MKKRMLLFFTVLAVSVPHLFSREKDILLAEFDMVLNRIQYAALSGFVLTANKNK